MRVRLSTAAALALALAILTAIPAHAAPKSPGQAEQARLFSRFVGFLGKLPGRLVFAWQKEGAIIDPFGGPGDSNPGQGNAPGANTGAGDEAIDK
jgi:hypothetical protein